MDNKVFLIVIFSTILLVVFVFLLFWNQPIKKWGRVCFGDNCFEVELAKSSLEKTKGLMFRKSMQDNKGMLFLFDREEKHSFWMKNTLIPLDIIWISDSNKVVFINKNTQPCKQFFCPSITPLVGAKYVLEINGGLAEKYMIKVGDMVDIAK